MYNPIHAPDKYWRGWVTWQPVGYMATSLLKIKISYRDRMRKQFTSYLLPFLMTSETTWSDGLALRLAGTWQLWYYFFFLGNLPPPHFILIFLLYLYAGSCILLCIPAQGAGFLSLHANLDFWKELLFARMHSVYMHGHSDYRNASCSNSASV